MSELKSIVSEMKDEFREYTNLVDELKEAQEKNDEARENEIKSYFEEADERMDELEMKFQRARVSERNDELSDGQKSERYQAFENYLRKGKKMDNEDAEKLIKFNNEFYGRKNITTDSLEDGGVFSVPEFDTEVVELLKETSPVRQFATIKQISQGDAWTGARKKSNAGAQWVGERTTGSDLDTDTGKYVQLRIQTHELEAKPKVSAQAQEDLVIDIVADLREDLREEFSIAENTAFISGDGVDKPEGIFTNDDIGSVTNGSATALDADKIIELRYSIKDGYINNAAFMLNRLTVAEVRKLKATDDNYLWQPGLAELSPATILGAPYAMAADLVAPSAGSYSSGDKPILYGDFSRGYYIVDKIGMQMLVDPYSSKPFTEYYTRKRTGGQVVQPEAIAYLSMTT